jgi:hypothetical protein
MIGIIQLSFFILLTNYNIIESKKTNTTNCLNPTSEKFGELMLKFERQFDGGFNMLDVDSVQKSIASLIIIDDFLKVNHRNERKCIKNNNDRIENKGLCSWHNRLSHREDRFPHLVMHAICNCNDCEIANRKTDDFEFSCQPLKKLQPALIRGGCRDNIFEWKPAFEYISVACLCMRNGTNLPLF